MNRILPLLALIIAAGIFFVYVNPVWTGSIATTQAAIAADNAALISAKQYLSRQDQLAAARDAIDPANLELIDTFLPDSVDNVGLILDLNALAARSQLSLSSINVNQTGSNTGASAGNSPVGSVDLSLSATGTFSALQDFLAGIEKSARLLDIRTLTVKGSDTGVYNYQMTIRLYWLH